jgi:hypothetical protein
MTDTPKPKTLKELAKELPSLNEIGRIYAEVQLAEDYAAAIISSSLMDTMLRYLIASHLIPMGASHEDNIFGDQRGVLRTLSSKIEMSYAMGLIGPETRGALEIVRKVRNFFAHYTSQVNFDTPEILAECRKIRTPKILREVSDISPIMTARNPAKLNYVHVCNFISVDIYNHVVFLGKPEANRFPTPIEIY